MKKKRNLSVLLAYLLAITFLLGSAGPVSAEPQRIKDWFPGKDRILAQAVAESLSSDVESEVTEEQLRSVHILYITPGSSSTIDLDGISNLKNLQDFSIVTADNIKIQNGGQLKTDSNLDHLLLCGQTINKSHFIKDMTQVNSLNLSNSIIEGDVLGSLSNLRHLTLEGIESISLNQIEGLQSDLTHLTISGGANIKQWKDLARFAHLKSLELLHVPLTPDDMVTVGKITSLDTLNLTKNGLADSDFSSVSSLKSLTHLTISRNSLTTLTAYQDLSELISLNLNHNDIEDIGPVKHLANLEYLSLDDNKIKNIVPIGTLQKLQKLVLPRNHIKDISPLAPVQSLQSVSLGYNQIRDPSPLKDLENLTYCGLDANQISNVSSLGHLYSQNDTYVSARHQQIILSDEDKIGNTITVNNIVVGPDGKPYAVRNPDMKSGGAYSARENTITFAGDFKEDRAASYQFVYQDIRFSGVVSQKFNKFYAVRFDTKGGSSENHIEKVKLQELVQEPSNPTMNTNRFRGWNTKADGSGEDWNFKSSKVTSDMTLYAQWNSATGQDGGDQENPGDPGNNASRDPNSDTQTGDSYNILFSMIAITVALLVIVAALTPSIRKRFVIKVK